MKLNRTPIAAALACMALASSPFALAAGDTTSGTTMKRSDSGAASGSSYGAASSMDSQTVRQVQQALTDKGHNPGPIDGILGPRTQAALQSYQRQNNLSGASGLDQQTLDSLGVQASSSVGASGRMAGTDSASSAGGVGSAAGGSGGGMSGTPSGSSASQGTASDGGPTSKNPSNVPGSTASPSGGRSGSSAAGSKVPTPSGSSASQGTASDGGPTSRNPSGGTASGDSGSSAGGTGSTTGGAGGYGGSR